MPRKKKTDLTDVLLDLTTLVPWWVSVLIALVSYLVFHAFAAADVAGAKTTAEFAPTIFNTFIKSFSMVLQYFVPLILLMGAAASAFSRNKRTTSAPISKWVDAGAPPRVRIEAPPGKPAGRHDDRNPENWQSADEVDPKPDIGCWSAGLLSALEWKRFEQVCAGLFERLGFEAKVSGFGSDGGVDIHLYRPPQGEPVAIVQCKARTSKKVGVEIVRAFHGVMTSKRVTEAILATSSGFTDDAKNYAKENRIDLMDGATILKSILNLTGEQQGSLLAIATEGDFTTPMCPSCGIKLTRRQPKAGGKPFWGCVNFPRCRSTINIAGS